MSAMRDVTTGVSDVSHGRAETFPDPRPLGAVDSGPKELTAIGGASGGSLLDRECH